MATKIYFAGSIRGGRQDVDIYYKIIAELREKYGTVLTEFVGDKSITEVKGSSEKGYGTDKNIHDNDVAMLQECHYLVAEVTQTSLGVGYEIGRANAMGKNILCLFRPGEKSLSAMIAGAENGTSFVVKNYNTLDEALEILKEYFTARNVSCQ